jgi:hypothetical protein
VGEPETLAVEVASANPPNDRWWAIEKNRVEACVTGGHFLRLENQGTIVASKSMFGKVYTTFARRLSINQIIATSIRVSLVCTFRS